ncbi:hypothetical protein NXS19_005736 [Fusarium pseudograminearum]|nr:hypothetical protein NXS19_005736 [Fusarium pseudograminearum]
MSWVEKAYPGCWFHYNGSTYQYSTACLWFRSGSLSLEHRGRCCVVFPMHLIRQELCILSIETLDANAAIETFCTCYSSLFVLPTQSNINQVEKAGLPFLWARNPPELNCKSTGTTPGQCSYLHKKQGVIIINRFGSNSTAIMWWPGR